MSSTTNTQAETETRKGGRTPTRNFLRLLNQYLRPYALWIVLAAVLTFLTTATTLPLPWIIKYLIDDVLVAGDSDKLVTVFLMVFGVMIGTQLVTLAHQYVIAHLSQRVKFHIRHSLVAHLHRLSLSYFDRTQTGKLMSRIISDGYAIQEMLGSGLVNIFTDFLTLVVILALLFTIHWKLALITVVVLPCYAITHRIFAGRMRDTSKLVRRKTDEVMMNLEECISGVRVVKSFVKERYESDQFKKKLDAHFELNMKQDVMGTLWNAIAGVISGAGAALVLWYGGTLIADDVLTIGTLLAFHAYTAFIYGPIVNLISVNVTVQRANAAIDRLFETVDTDPLIKDAPDAVSLENSWGHVVLDHVTFGYSEQSPVLRDVSLEAKPGMKIGIVGPSGSGKSTLVKLIPRLYDVPSGAVKIDGLDVKKLELVSVRERVGMVPQDSTLFTGTISDNIRYGKLDASDDDIMAVARMANVHDFIMTLDHEYETRIGEQGMKLSGGQKQRISIARALLTDPTILILDDCTSALDSKTEARIQATLNDLMKDRTSFIVAHRLSSVIHCDVINVLVDGEIVELGSHDELMEGKGLYSKMYARQYRMEEPDEAHDDVAADTVETPSMSH